MPPAPNVLWNCNIFVQVTIWERSHYQHEAWERATGYHMRSRGGSDTETEESSGHCEDVSTCTCKSHVL